MAFIVKNIIDGTTIEVEPRWSWKDKAGSFVKIKGYEVPALNNSFAINKLNTLIKGKDVDLKNAVNIIEDNSGNTIQCSVYLNGIDISQYFPELKTS